MKTRIETITVSASELAAVLALSQRHVRRLSADGVLPKPAKGKWPLAEAVASYVKHLKGRAEKATLTAARTRRAEAQATLAEFEVAEKSATLVSVAVMVARLTPALASMRQCLLSSTLAEDERDELMDALNKLLCDAIGGPESQTADAGREGE
jgi:phage terminase Nu1 subunit (DNA packaging protein)